MSAKTLIDATATTLFFTCLLVACGGGGDSTSPASTLTSSPTTTPTSTPPSNNGTPTPSPKPSPQPTALDAQKYVGNWKSTCMIDPSAPGTSSMDNWAISGTSQKDVVNIVGTFNEWNNATCSGAPSSSQTDIGSTMKVIGTKALSDSTIADKLDKSINSQGVGANKFVFVLNGTTLKAGSAHDTKDLDASGYPNVVTETLTKQ